jgi:hypothetical protein
MAYCGGSFNLFENFGIKNIAYKTHTLTVFDGFIFGSGYTGAFLTPVLEGEETVID